MKKVTFALLLLLTFGIFAQSHNYKQVKIYLKDANSVKELIKAGVELSDPSFEKDHSVVVFLTFKDFEILQTTGFNYEILIDNWKKHYASRPKVSEETIREQMQFSESLNGVKGFSLGSMGGYLTTDEIYNKLDEMRTDYPNLITEKYSIGNTYEGRPQYVVKISDNPDVDEEEPEVFINSLIHCREPAAMMTVMYYMYYLLENYGTDPEVTYLVDNREIYFMPLYNVDGYEYNIQNDPSGGGMWRKNRRNNSDGSYGVDLNRNFGYQWGYDNSGSSGSPSSETYRGTAAFSEPSNANFRDFVESRNIVTCLNYHTYSNYYLYAWGYEDLATPDSMVFRTYAGKMSEYNGYTTGRPPQILYEVNGNTDDWMYGEQTTKNKNISFTPEVGESSDGFWPTQNRIIPLAMENLHANLLITWAAGAYIENLGVTFEPEYVNPGNTVTLLPYLKNIGMNDADDITITVSSDSPYLNMPSDELNVASLGSWSELSLTEGIEFSVTESAPIGTRLPIYVETFLGDVSMDTDTVYFTPGTPTFMFNDNNDDPTVMFNVSGESGHPVWEATQSTFASPAYSYADSKNGDYESYAVTVMETKSPISLSGVAGPVLSFWTKWNIENNWDCGQVMISTNNGSTWTPLEGMYSDAGSGSGQQTTGEPVYDDVQAEWVNEEIDLSDYVNQNIKLKFELRSDSYIERDGWYLDDIKIYYYGSDPGNQVCVDVEFAEGWNLLSVPVAAASMNTEAVYPDASGPAYSFNNGYVNNDVLTTDLGYWLKFDNSGSTVICGNKLDNEVAVSAGWNMIGVNDSTHTVSNITTSPSGILTTNFFEFSNGYSVPSELTAGKGYWVSASQAGTVYLNGIAESKANKRKETGVALTLADGKGRTTLYLLDNKSEKSFEMPPLPPAGTFDARFEDNTFGKYNTGSEIVKLQTTESKLKMTASSEVKVTYLTLGGMVSKVFSANETAEIAAPKDGKLYISSIAVPEEYSLNQNYPNPFNPSTTIKFALPVEAKVTITLYNVLGQRVNEIVSNNFTAGVQTVNFNASELASGMYIYQISAQGVDGSNFVDTKKMMLMK